MSPILQGLANGSVRGYGGFFGATTPPAFDSIASASGGSSSVIFNSIPQTYQYLQLRVNAQTTATSGHSCLLRCNGVSTSSYWYHIIRGDGSGLTVEGSSATGVDEIFRLTGSPGNNTTAAIIDIYDYASTTRTKTIRSFYGNDANGSGLVGVTSGFFNSTNAITSLTIELNSFGNSFSSSSRFSLYGIKGA